MLFPQLVFVYLFLPILLFLYYINKSNSWRRGVLLIFSLLFYAWGEPIYILLMLLSAVINYVFGLFIGAAETDRGKKIFVIIGVVLNLALLGYYKYTGFVLENINAIFGLSIPIPQIALPLGISFYTFQAMTYIIDVYRGNCETQGKFSRVLLYICLFPQLVAGPIVRYTDVQDQLDDRRVNAAQINNGLWRFTLGLAKKVLLSNSCSLVCENLFANSGTTVLGNWCGILFYALQIYFDFSGYSDMAIGLGHMFGFIFNENFNYPYIAKNISDYWRRWHISMSTWFRDYLFYPVMRSNLVSEIGKKLRKSGHKSAARAVPTIIALVVVWFSTGLWHGASWNYVLWGLYYGFWLIMEQFVIHKLIKKTESGIGLVFGRIGFIAITLVGYALFYHEQNLFAQLGYMFGIGSSGFSDFYVGPAMYSSGLLLIASLVCVTPVGHTIFEKVRGQLRAGFGAKDAYAMDRVIKTVIIVILLILCTIRMAGNSYAPFIYERF